MPIVDTVISAEIYQFMVQAQDAGSSTNEDNQKIKSFADNLAGVISNAIKSATVTVALGIPVATAGSAVAQTGATTATGTAIIS